MIPTRKRKAVLGAWALAAMLAACLAGCDTKQIAAPILTGVQWTRITNSTDFPDPIAPDWRGDKIAFQYRVVPNSIITHLAVIDPAGALVKNLPAGSTERISPARWVDDSTLIFASNRSGNFDIWTWAITTDQLNQLTADPGNEFDPAPRPGSPGFAFIDSSEFHGRVTLIAAPGGEKIYLTSPSVRAAQIDWDPSGQRLCFNADSSGFRHICLVTLAPGDTSLVQLTTGPYIDSAPRFSPDGTRIVFTSDNRTGRSGIWTISPDNPAAGLSLIVFEDKNVYMDTPCWSPDGTKIVVSSPSHNYPSALWVLSDLP